MPKYVTFITSTNRCRKRRRSNGKSINLSTFIIHHKNPLQNCRSSATTQSNAGRDGINSEGNLFSGFYRPCFGYSCAKFALEHVPRRHGNFEVVLIKFEGIDPILGASLAADPRVQEGASWPGHKLRKPIARKTATGCSSLHFLNRVMSRRDFNKTTSL
ncbi:hypothetical protein Zmor_022371 [Zophobas morio]|uniref:Uncharacterized protein n=1 Tax=Zophobas morio TaxID=2755281 RepID=A0AA38HWS9_9CUCU|nr:hypothetical protein Zmor_022371 [Zophobas morio]